MLRMYHWFAAGLCCAALLAGTAGVAQVEEPLPAITAEPGGQMRPGKFVFADLLTGDVQRASSFYAKVFDWRIVQGSDPGYATAYVGRHPVAAFAIYRDRPSEDALWLPSVSVRDVDATAALVEPAGGQVVVAPRELPDRGRMAVLKDPRGAHIALLRATGGDPEDHPPHDNEWIWPELWTDDVPASIAFYEALFNYRSVAVKDPEGRLHKVLGRDQVARAGVLQSPLPGVSPNWLLYLLVEDLAHSLGRIVEHGGEVYVPPQKDAVNGDIAIVADPTGGVFALQQRTGRDR